MDRGTPGFEIRSGYNSVSHRGYHNCILNFDNCRLPKEQMLGEPHAGFTLANEWLYATRLTVAAMAVGRARRAMELALPYAVQRKQFGQLDVVIHKAVKLLCRIQRDRKDLMVETLSQDIQRSNERCHRGAQFVREHRDEVALEVIEFFQALTSGSFHSGIHRCPRSCMMLDMVAQQLGIEVVC